MLLAFHMDYSECVFILLITAIEIVNAVLGFNNAFHKYHSTSAFQLKSETKAICLKEHINLNKEIFQLWEVNSHFNFIPSYSLKCIS